MQGNVQLPPNPKVPFPTSFLAPTPVFFTAKHAPSSPSFASSLYRLMSSRLTAGHYTSYCYNKNISSWIHFNDNRVQVVTAEDVEAAQPYLLFFQRIPSEVGTCVFRLLASMLIPATEKTIPGSPIRKAPGGGPPTPVLSNKSRKINLQKKPLTLSDQPTIQLSKDESLDDQEGETPIVVEVDQEMEDHSIDIKQTNNSKKAKKPTKPPAKPPPKPKKTNLKAKSKQTEPEGDMDIEEEQDSDEEYSNGTPPKTKKTNGKRKLDKDEAEKPPAKKRRISATELKELKDSSEKVPNSGVKRSWNAELQDIQTEATKNVDDRPLAQRRPTRNTTLHKTVR